MRSWDSPRFFLVSLITGTAPWIYFHAISQNGRNRKFSAFRAFKKAAWQSILSGNCHGQY